jgi:S-(hydroxymethyl)glutathione dehydrogenase/alcohol dehydrogenase
VTTTRAAVLWERRAPLAIEDVHLAEPGPGEVRVRFAASGVCHSDYHHQQQETSNKPPLLLGHEGAGTIEAVGAGVTNVAAGDHVVVAFGNKCGQCFFCIRGEPALCTPPWGTGSAALPTRVTKDGLRINQYQCVGSFAEHGIVFATNCVPIPNDASLVTAALIACGVATGYGAVVHTAKVGVGETVAVIGCGGVDLNVIQTAHLVGAARIIAVDTLPHKLDLARDFGATDTILAPRATPASAPDPAASNRRDPGHPSAADPVARVKELTNGIGVDHAFEAVGSAPAIRQAYDMARKSGAAIVVGVAPEESEVTIPAADVMRTGKRLLGCAAGDVRPHLDFPRIVDLWQTGRLKLDELVSRRYPLDDVNEALRAMVAGEVARAVLVYD